MRCVKTGVKFEGTRQRGQRRHLKKTWWDCVIGDMESFHQSCEKAQYRDHWRLKIKRKTANPGYLENGH